MKTNKTVPTVLLLGLLALVGCTSTSNSNDKQDDKTKDNSNNDKPKSNSNENKPIDEISEEDIVNKSHENVDGQDYIKYELKDGSVIIGAGSEDDIDEVNEAIRDMNKQNGNK